MHTETEGRTDVCLKKSHYNKHVFKKNKQKKLLSSDDASKHVLTDVEEYNTHRSICMSFQTATY